MTPPVTPPVAPAGEVEGAQRERAPASGWELPRRKARDSPGVGGTWRTSPRQRCCVPGLRQDGLGAGAPLCAQGEDRARGAQRGCTPSRPRATRWWPGVAESRSPERLGQAESAPDRRGQGGRRPGEKHSLKTWAGGRCVESPPRVRSQGVGTRACHGTRGARGPRKGARARQRHCGLWRASPEAPRASILALPLGVPVTPQCWYPERCPTGPTRPPRAPELVWSHPGVGAHDGGCIRVLRPPRRLCFVCLLPRGSGTSDTLALGRLADK